MRGHGGGRCVHVHTMILYASVHAWVYWNVCVVCVHWRGSVVHTSCWGGGYINSRVQSAGCWECFHAVAVV